MIMDLSEPYNQGLMLYDLKSGLRGNESAPCINSTFGEDNFSECTAQDWFTLFWPWRG